MKKILLGLPLIALFTFSVLFTSCDNDDEIINDLPGQIPGLGDNKGELTGVEFKLPEGVQLDGDILTSTVDDVLQIGSWWDGNGSGGCVKLTLRLKNLTNKAVDVELPAGLIMESLSGEYQNGVLLKKTRITVLASDETQPFLLEMYGGNKSLQHTSVTKTEKYEFAVVSNSSLIVDLCNRLANKKINKEEFGSSVDNYNYEGYTSMVQSMLWSLTDGKGLTEDDIEYINSLPDSSK
jgi:hypothetical protein